MLKNEMLVKKMSLEERIQLIICNEKNKLHSVGKYDFPESNIVRDPLLGKEHMYVTAFPSDKALACSWNSELVKDSYKIMGFELSTVVKAPYINVSNELGKEEISDDYYLTASFLANKISGLRNSERAGVNVELLGSELKGKEFKEKVELISHLLIKSNPDSIIIRNDEDIIKHERNNSLFFGNAGSEEEIIKLLGKGCSLVFTDLEINSELIEAIADKTIEYKKAQKAVASGLLSAATLEEKLLNCEVLNEDLINEACDNLIELFKKFEEKENEESSYTIDKTTHHSEFDEYAHDIEALKAAHESIVMLKNEKILPLDHHVKVAVLGEYAKDINYQKQLFSFNPTNLSVVFDKINDYEDITTVGYAYGYVKGERNRIDLLRSAVTLCSSADVAIVYLYANAEDTSLPEGQLELLDTLHERNIKIIAVVTAANSSLDMSFVDKCDAVLFNYNAGQAVTSAVLDLIVGNVTPSAKLVEPLGNFPMGYGLSYTTFVYHTLKVGDNGVTFTVSNTGKHDGASVAQLYVLDEKGNKSLKGYCKVFVKAHGSEKGEIKFDDFTFRSYDDKKKKYFIKGGNYVIQICEDINTEALRCELTLEEHYYDNEFTFVNETIETSDDLEKELEKFVDTKSRREKKKENKGLSFGTKLAIAISILAYYDIIAIVLLTSNIIADDNIIFPIVIIALSVVFNFFLIRYIVRLFKNKKETVYFNKNDSLSRIIEKADTFNEIAKVSYKTPLVENEEIDEEEELPVIEEPTEEEKETIVEEITTFESEFVSYEEEVFTEEASLNELCVNFLDFSTSKGINVELSSIRSLFAALAASKITFLNIKNKDLLDKFLSILNEYFGNTGEITSASDEWDSPFNLYWKVEDGKYVTSDFINAVNHASTEERKNAIAILNNVNVENLKTYFLDFLKFALTPSERHVLKINDDLRINLSRNINYILVPTSSSYVEYVTRDLANACVCINMVISTATREVETPEIKNLSYQDFQDLVVQAKDEVYLNEKIWKKIDELEESIGAVERFRIGNKNTLQIERYTSVLLECGGDESEAFSNIFVGKIVPILKNTATYKKDGGERTIIGLVEKIFNEEDLGRIKKALNKRNG